MIPESLTNTSLMRRVEDASKEVLEGLSNSPILADAKKATEKIFQIVDFRYADQLDLSISSFKACSRGSETILLLLEKEGVGLMFLAPLIKILIRSSSRIRGGVKPFIRWMNFNAAR